MYVKELLAGFNGYPKAHRVIMKHKLWPWIAVPGVMSFVYLLVLVILGTTFLPGVSASINQNWVPDFLSGGATYYLVSVLLWLFLIIAGYLSYQQIILILFSPILGYVSETVETKIYQQPPPEFSLKDLIRDILRGLTINLRNLGWMLLLTGMAWLLSIIPLVGALISPFLIILIQSYYSGFGLVDYTLERKRYSVSESIAFVHQNKGRVTGVGLGFVLLLLVPLIGWFFAPGYGSVAATLAALETINDREIPIDP